MLRHANDQMFGKSGVSMTKTMLGHWGRSKVEMFMFLYTSCLLQADTKAEAHSWRRSFSRCPHGTDTIWYSPLCPCTKLLRKPPHTREWHSKLRHVATWYTPAVNGNTRPWQGMISGHEFAEQNHGTPPMAATMLRLQVVLIAPLVESLCFSDGVPVASLCNALNVHRKQCILLLFACLFKVHIFTSLLTTSQSQLPPEPTNVIWKLYFLSLVFGSIRRVIRGWVCAFGCTCGRMWKHRGRRVSRKRRGSYKQIRYIFYYLQYNVYIYIYIYIC